MHDPKDDATTVEELRELLRQFVHERQWERFHNPKNLAMSLAIETAELMEHFQWLTLEQANQIAQDPDRREAICDEIADCLAYVLAIANAIDIDLATELRRKMLKNARKYPADQSRGNWEPPRQSS